MRSFRFRVLCVLLCFLLATAFVSCAEQENDDPQHDSTVKALDMSLVTHGGLFQMQAVSDAGCYEIYNHIDGHGKLFFYDFATNQISFVTNQPIPTDDETNPGWVSDTMGGVTPIFAGDSLYLFKRGALPLPTENHPGYESYIIKMTPDGTNRQRIYLSAWQEFGSGEIAFDGKHLYFLINEYNSETSLLEQCYLCRTDFESLQLEVLHELGTDSAYSLAAVYEEGLILQRFSEIGVTVDEYNMEVPLLENTAVLYSLHDDALTDTGITWENGTISYTFGTNAKMYYTLLDEQILRVYDLYSSESAVVCDTLNVDSLILNSVYIEGSIIDNHIPLYFSALIQSEQGTFLQDIPYYYDLETNSVVKVEFEDIAGIDEANTYIVGETEEVFFLCIGSRYVATTVTSQNGDTYTFDELILEYATIAKEDYWNSAANFMLFTDQVH